MLSQTLLFFAKSGQYRYQQNDQSDLVLADMADFAVVNQVMMDVFKAPFPARTCFAVKGLPKGLRSS